MTQGIYAITNKLNGKTYIGSSTYIENRFHVHKSLLRAGKHSSPKLQKEWNEYGADSFELLVIREIKEPISYQLLVEIEQEFIDQYKAQQQHYNASNAVVTPKAKKRKPFDSNTYYARRTAGVPRRYCTLCDTKLRADNDRPICSKCWQKSDEGREYFRLTQIKSRQKQPKD